MPAGPTQSRAWLLVKNGLANLLRAFSSSAVAVLLPLLLVLILSPQSYAAWALIFSIGAFVVYLDLGVPTTVQAMVGRAISSGENSGASQVTASGLKIVTAVSVFCLIAAAVTALFFAELFPAVPAAVRLEAQISLVIVFFGQTANLVGNTASAYFAGQQRSFVPAAILAPARVASMLAALSAALITSDLVWTSVSFAIPLLAGSAILVARYVVDARGAARASLSGSHQPAEGASRAEHGVRALLRYSGPLMVWGLCVLLITGTGTILVARFDYASIVPFSIATVIVSALAGLSTAATAPLLPELARTHALDGINAVSRQVRTLSVLTSSLLFATTAFLLAAAPWYLPILDRRLTDGIGHSWWILAVLLVGNTVHLSGAPMSLAFIATKTHTRVVFPPVIQAVVSFGTSILLGSFLGALGVALGVFLGAILGVLMMFTWSIRLTSVFDLRAVEMLSSVTFMPLLKVAPVVLIAGAVATWGQQMTWWAIAATALSLALAYFALWKGLSPAWRHNVTSLVARRLKRAR